VIILSEKCRLNFCVILHIFNSVRYNSVITVQTNKFTHFYDFVTFKKYLQFHVLDYIIFSPQLCLLLTCYTVRNFRQFCCMQNMKTLSDCFIQLCAP